MRLGSRLANPRPDPELTLAQTGANPSPVPVLTLAHTWCDARKLASVAARTAGCACSSNCLSMTSGSAPKLRRCSAPAAAATAASTAAVSASVCMGRGSCCSAACSSR